MRILLIIISVLSISCSSKQNRKPAVESEICKDYKNNIICIQNNKCYITNISNSFEQQVSCELLKETN